MSTYESNAAEKRDAATLLQGLTRAANHPHHVNNVTRLLPESKHEHLDALVILANWAALLEELKDAKQAVNSLNSFEPAKMTVCRIFNQNKANNEHSEPAPIISCK